MILKRSCQRIFSIFSLTCFISGQVLAPALADLPLINAGEIQVVESSPGNPYTYSTAGNITINGMLQGLEVASPGGARTGNGGNLVLTTTGGTFLIGPNGMINVNAISAGGRGGSVTINAPVLTVDGKISASGLTTGAGGTIVMNGGTITLNGTSAMTAAAGSANTGAGGVVDINGTGVVTANGAISSAGVTTLGSKNWITIDGAGVNIGGKINADSVSNATTGGKIEVTATGTSTTTIASTGIVQATGKSYTSNGGSITFTGNLTNSGGKISANSGTGNKTGGTILIGNGDATKQFTNQNNGQITANGVSSEGNSNGGTITVNTGTVTLSQGMVQANGGLVAGTGNAGTINITSRSASGMTINGTGSANSRVQAIGSNNGGITLSSTAGATTIGADGWVKASGSTLTAVTISGVGVNVAGAVSNDGNLAGHGGNTLINALGGNFVLSGNGKVTATGGTSPTGGGNGSNGGIVSILAQDISLQNNGSIAAYGFQKPDLSTGLGQGGVITLAASRDFLSSTNTNINARGVSVPSGSTYTKSVINITATRHATLDGFIQVGGRKSYASGGGLISSSVGQNLTVASSVHLAANGDQDTSGGNFTGAGGRVDLISSSGNITINGGLYTDGSGYERGLIDIAGGLAGGAGGELNITALNGTVTSNGILVRGRSRNVSDLGGRVVVLANAIVLDNATNIQTRGLSNSSKNFISLQAGSVALNGATLDAAVHAGGSTGGSVQIFSSGVNTLADADYAGVDVSTNTSTAGASVDIRGSAISSTNNTLNFGARTNLFLRSTNGNITTSGSSFTGNNITMESNGATGNISVTNGSVVANATSGTAVFDVNGVGNVNLSGTALTSGSFVNFEAANGTVTASGDFTNANNVKSTVQGAGSSLAVTATAGNLRLGTTNSAVGNVSFTSNNGTVLSVSNAQVFSTSGNILLDSDTSALNFSTSGTISAGGNVILEAATSIAAGAGTYVGRVDASAANGGVNITSAAGTVTLGNISSANSTVTATNNGGSFNLANGTTISSPSTVLLSATGNITDQGTTINTASSHFSLNGNLDFTTGTLNATTIQIYGKGSTNPLVARAANVNLTKAGSYTVSRLNSSGIGAIKATGVNSDLTISSADTTGTITLQADRNIVATASNNFQGGVRAYGDAGTADYLNNVTISQTNSLNIDQLVSTAATLTASGAGKTLTLNQANINNGTVTLNTPGNIVVSNSTIDGGDDLRAISSGSGLITLTSNTMGLLYVRSTGSTGNDGLYAYTGGHVSMSGNTLTGNLDFDSAGSNLTSSSGTFGGTININANDINLVGSGNLDVDTVTAASNAMFTTTDGNIDDSGGVITATNGVAQLVSNGANKTVTVGAAINARDIVLGSNGTGGDIVLNNTALTARTGTAGGTVTIAANDQIDFNSAGSDIFADATANGSNGGKITVTAGGVLNMNDAGTQFVTTGFVADGQESSKNYLSLTAGTLNINGDLLAEGQTGYGSKGGTIMLRSTASTVLGTSADIMARGFVFNNARRGNGGNIQIDADNTITLGANSHIDASSVADANVQGLTNYGGFITLIGDKGITINDGTGANLTARGASYTGGSGLIGGAGGGITLFATQATSNPRINVVGTSSVVFDVRGGNGQGAAGGAGGLVHFVPGNGAPGLSTMPFSIFSGLGGTGSTTGNAGQIWIDGSFCCNIPN